MILSFVLPTAQAAETVQAVSAVLRFLTAGIDKRRIWIYNATIRI